MLGHLAATIPGERTSQRGRELCEVVSDRAAHRVGLVPVRERHDPHRSAHTGCCARRAWRPRRGAYPSPGRLPNARPRTAQSRRQDDPGSRRCSATGHDRASPAPCAGASPCGQSEGAEPPLRPALVGRRDRWFGRSSRATPSAWDRWDVLGEATRRSARETSPPPVGPAHRQAAPGSTRAGTVWGNAPRSHAAASAAAARYASRPPLRAISRETVDAERPINAAIARADKPAAMPRETSSRSVAVR